MSLTLKMNYNTVTIGGKNVKLVEAFDNRTAVNRFVETLRNGADEAAVNYILDTDYDNSDKYIRNYFNEYVEALNKRVRVMDTFGLESQILGRNAGAGFTAMVKEEDFADSVTILKNLLYILGLSKEYRLVARYENEAVYAIVRQ